MLKIALCNRQHYELMKPHLWTAVRIRDSDLIAPELSPPILENIHYASSLTVGGSFSTGDGSDTVTQNVCSNTNRLLEAMNTAKVKILFVRGHNRLFPIGVNPIGFVPSSILNLIPKLSCLQILDLWNITKVEESLWNNMLVPQTLTIVSIKGCKLSVKFLNLILGNEKLREVEIIDTQPFNNELLHHLSGRANLTRLELQRIGNETYGFDLNYLGSLNKLEDLTIASLSIQDRNMLELWRNMNNLKRLLLYELDISDEGFSGVKHLQNLEHFHMEKCARVSGSCFVSNISPMDSLRELIFDHLPFVNIPDGRHHLDVVVCPLNEMASLREITIESSKRPGIMHSLCRSQQEKKWIVTVDYSNWYTLERP